MALTGGEKPDHSTICQFRSDHMEAIKEARGFRQFLRRGLNNVAGEWALLCTVHKLLKLAGTRTVAAS